MLIERAVFMKPVVCYVVDIIQICKLCENTRITILITIFKNQIPLLLNIYLMQKINITLLNCIVNVKIKK